MICFESLLKGGDRRSIGQSNKIVGLIDSQERFDELFKCLFHSDRKVAMRAADAVEKVSLKDAGYLHRHKQEVLTLLGKAEEIEIKWHLAILVSRLKLTRLEMVMVWQTLAVWAADQSESKIVRVNSLQGLFNLSVQNKSFKKEFHKVVSDIETENIPSLKARIRKLKEAL